MDGVDHVYEYVPSYDEAVALVEQDPISFGKYEEVVDDQTIVSFKYSIASGRFFARRRSRQTPDASGSGACKSTYQIGMNMRGIVFDHETKKLLALPFPKFFNVGESASGVETLDDVDWERVDAAVEKVDGSLISFVRVGSRVYPKTMRSLSNEVVCAVQAYLDEQPEIVSFAGDMIDSGWSPLFEFVSPQRRIVVAYPEPALYFLGARNMETGVLVLSKKELDNGMEVPAVVKEPVRIAPERLAVASYLELPNVEGVVLRVAADDDTGGCAKLLKVKSASYVALHKGMCIESPGGIAKALVAGILDDRLAALSTAGLRERVALVDSVCSVFHARVEEINAVIHHWIEQEPDPRVLPRLMVDAGVPLPVVKPTVALAWSGNLDIKQVSKAVAAEMGALHIRAFAQGINKPPWYFGPSHRAHLQRWTSKALSRVWLGPSSVYSDSLQLLEVEQEMWGMPTSTLMESTLMASTLTSTPTT